MKTQSDVRHLLRKIDLPAHFTFSNFVLRIGLHLSKEIRFIPWQFPPEITGACLQTKQTAYIFYAEGVAPAYRTLILFHELVHLITGDSHSHIDESIAVVVNVITRSIMAYNSEETSVALRTTGTSELEVDRLAIELMQRLLPERTGGAQTLARLYLD